MVFSTLIFFLFFLFFAGCQIILAGWTPWND
jgi:hypothetical protein